MHVRLKYCLYRVCDEVRFVYWVLRSGFCVSAHVRGACCTLCVACRLKFMPRQLCPPFFLKTSDNHSISHLSRRLDLALYFKRPSHLVDSTIYKPVKSKWSPNHHNWSPALSTFITSVRADALEQLRMCMRLRKGANAVATARDPREV
jgi:hypothetical protein